MSNGNTLHEDVLETLPEDVGQGTQPRMIEEAGRVKRGLRNLKGLLRREVSACIDKMLYFKTKYKDDSKIGYANEILTTYKQIKIRYTNIENKIFDLRMLYCENWEDDEEELDLVLDGLTQELVAYEQKF